MGNFVKDPFRLWPDCTIPYAWGKGFDSASTVIISSWVGRKGNATGAGNDAADVRVIQRALNDVPAARGGPSAPLVLDGIAGNATQTAIQKFQLKWFGWPGADSRVDPDGPTLAELNEQKQSVNDPDQLIVEAAIGEWNRVLKGSVQWRPATDKDANRVVFAKDDGHNRSETLGRKPGGTAQLLYVNLSKLPVLMKFGRVTPTGVLLHEMGHAAGLGHEHQREDRDKYVRIDQSNVGRCCDFRIKDSAECSCRERVVECQSFGAYDYGSTMHYFANQAAKVATKPVLVAIDAAGKAAKPQPVMGGLAGFNGSDLATLRHFYRGGKH